MKIGDPDYEQRKRDWIARQIANCPPLTEEQKAVIRSAFAADRTAEAGAA